MRNRWMAGVAGLALVAGCGGQGSSDGHEAAKAHGHDHGAMATAAESSAATGAEATQPGEATQPDGDPHAHMNHETLPASDVVPGASLYQLDVPLTGDDGASLDWDAWRGGPVLVSMIYSSCTTACPLIVKEVKRIREAAGVEGAKVLLVSMDPERDTPEALAAMKERHDLGDEWTLARTDDNGVRMVSAALGVRYRLLPSGDFNHSQIIALLDGDGVIVARAEGLGPQRDDVIAGLKAMP